MSTSTSVTELKINKLTKAQYDGIATPSNTELYFVKDEAISYEDLIDLPDFADVALSGDYNDLINTPTIKQPNWTETNTSDISYIRNKPNLSTVAITGSYNDLINKPLIPTTTNLVMYNSTEALTSGGAYTNLVSNVLSGTTADKINVTKAGITTTITVNNVANATVASKLGTSTVGSTTRPIYLNGGVPTQINYTISKSVPSDAKFTDTTYSVFAGANGSTAGTSGLVKAPGATDNTKFLRGDCSWAEIPNEIPSQSGNNGKFLKTNGSTVSWANVPEELPSQSGNSGKFLTTNGTAVSWASVDAFPSQSGNSGKFLTTNGTAVSWANVPNEIPSQSGNSGKFLTTNGTAVSWATVDAFPSQTGNAGKYLTTDGTTTSWTALTWTYDSSTETLTIM